MCRLEKARIMLTDSYKSVSQIPYDCGFHTYDGFIKAFKKQYAVSPTEYRKNGTGGAPRQNQSSIR